MAYTLNRRLAQLVDSNGQLNTGKIPNDYITSDHISDNTITSAMLHTSFTVSTSNLTAIDTDDVSEGSTNLYFTNARADARIAAATTDDLTEGSTNLYFTNARADARIAAATTDDLTEGSTNLYYTTARWDTKMAAADTDDLTEGSTNLYFTNERVDDRVNALLTAGTGITLTYDDANNTLTVAGAAQYGDSDVESYLSGGTGVTFSSGVISIGQDVGTSATPTFGNTIVGTLQATSFSDGTISGITFIDEDSFATNSATRVPTQQSIKAYVDAQVAGVVDSAPATLDTLNELAAALGDDANFSTTTSTALGNRLRVDTAAQGLTGTQQANAITNLGITATKAELNYVDGVTSNIQTQLDGKQASGSYLTGNQTITLSGDVSGSGTTSIAVTIADDSHNHVISNVDGLQTALDAKLASSSYTAADVLTKIKTVDGTGSGLDADLLDGIGSGSFLRSDAGDSWNIGRGTVYVENNSGDNSSGAGITLRTSNNPSSGDPASVGNIFAIRSSGQALRFAVGQSITSTGDNDFTTNNLTANGNITVTGTVDGRDVASDGSKLDGIESGATADQSASEILTLIKTVDGSGSGLDADLLDGISSGSFLRSDATDTATGAYTFTNNTNLKLRSSSNGVGIGIDFSDHAGGSYAQAGTINFVHSDGSSYGSGAAFILSSTEATTTILANGKLMYGEGIYLKPGTGTGAGTRKDLNWDTAYSWGNHASAGYLTGITSSDVTTALGYTPYQESTALSATSGTFSGDITVSGNQVFTAATNARTKFCVWTGTTYGIGMGNGYTYGGIANNYVMSFQMSNTNDRGFWWGDSSHTNAQGAMALTTDGYLTVANGIRVGYGEADTTHPEGGLDVNGIIQCKGNDFLDSDTSSHYIKAPAHLYFYTNGSTIAGRYMSSGNFAVGPNTPGTSSTQFDLALFHLDRTNTNFFTSRNNSGGFTHRIYADYANAGSTIEYQAACGETFAGVRLQTWTDHPLTLGQSNTEILRIADNSTGTNPRVGIGSTSPSFNLHVRGSGGNEGTFGVESAGNSLFRVVANNAANAYFQGGTSSATSQIPIYFTGMNGSNNTMTVNTTNKRVGVNDTGPDIMFGVYGDSSTMGTAHFVSPKGSNESHVHYGTNGNWYIRPANNSGNVIVKNYSAESDERLKENIVDITYGLSDLIQLQPRQFNWIDDVEEREQNGFIAQEVEAIIPALVSTGEGENAYKAVDYNSIIAILVKSVQELKAENDALKTRLDNGGL